MPSPSDDRDFFRFPRLAKELGPRDTVFRMDMSRQERLEKPPFTAVESPAVHEHLAVWDKLLAGAMTEEEALEEITQLMEAYYGIRYPLYRGFNH